MINVKLWYDPGCIKHPIEKEKAQMGKKNGPAVNVRMG
jgi:hypothetical protein